MGLEPTRLLRAQDFKSCVYTDFTTAAGVVRGAGRGNRTLAERLEIFRSTTKLYPRRVILADLR